MSGTIHPSGPTRGTSSRSLLLTVDEAADLLGLNRRSLYRLAKAGRIKLLKLHRRATRVERAEIDNYLERLREAAEQTSTEVA